MVGSDEALKIDLTCARWAGAFLSRGLIEMSAAFARTDRIAADLIAKRDEFIERGWSVEPLAEIARILRGTLMDAKAATKQATKPH